MKLSVIIPAYNEQKTLRSIIDKVLATGQADEIVIVDDGSTDGTKQIMQELKSSNVKIVSHEHNQGKGAAISTGIKQCQGDVILIQDADDEYDPSDYEALLAPIRSGAAQVVYGSRILKADNPQGPLPFYLGGRIVTMCTNILYGSKLTDEPTCYKVFESQTIKDINIDSEGFEWEPEITAKLLKRGVDIYEIPISYKPRSKQEGKKIKSWDGIKAIITLLRYKFKQT